MNALLKLADEVEQCLGSDGPVPAWHRLCGLPAELRALATTLAAREDAPAWFPLLGTPFAIRWSMLDERQAQKNHSQSLATLASRGGLCPSEAIANIDRRDYRDVAQRQAFEAMIAAAPPAQGTGEGDAALR